MKRPIIDPKKSYIFSDYFKLSPPIDELLTYFGYQHKLDKCILPQTKIELESLTQLKADLTSNICYMSTATSAARREALIGPTLLILAKLIKLPIHVDYPIKVSKQLQGELDYFLTRQNNLVIVEAKRENLNSGFIQLATQLIALDQYLDENNSLIYGAVTMGAIWQFGILDRTTKLITQDVINSYRVPADLQELLAILIAILEGKGNNDNTTK